MNLSISINPTKASNIIPKKIKKEKLIIKNITNFIFIVDTKLLNLFSKSTFVFLNLIMLDSVKPNNLIKAFKIPEINEE